MAKSLWKAIKCIAENLGDTIKKITLEGALESFWQYGKAYETYKLMFCTVQCLNSVKALVEPTNADKYASRTIYGNC